MRSIKLFLLAVIAVCFCTNVNAVELGDYMEIDGIPSIVIYVDASGEHGLVMSATAHRDDIKNIQKIFASKHWEEYKSRCINEFGKPRPDFEAAYLDMPEYDYKAYKKMRKNIMKKHLPALASMLTEKGKENAEKIADYCADNGIDMSIYFPDQTWAQSLGEGWFIPGNAEIELYAVFLGEGQEIGEDYAKSIFEIQKKDKKWNNGVWSMYHLHRYIVGYTGGLVLPGAEFFAPTNLKSSTLIKSAWTFEDENQGKIYKKGKIGIRGNVNNKKKYNDFYTFGALYGGSLVNPKNWLDFYVHYWKSGPWFGAMNYGPYIVAVKEF